VVAHFALRWAQKLPAQKLGDLYKNRPQQCGAFL
jgi:hypothetical protein